MFIVSFLAAVFCLKNLAIALLRGLQLSPLPGLYARANNT